MEQERGAEQRAGSQPQEREDESELQVSEKASSASQVQPTAAVQGPTTGTRKVQNVRLKGTRVKCNSSWDTDAGMALPRSQVWVPSADEEHKEKRGLCHGQRSKQNKVDKGKDCQTRSLPLDPPSDDLEVLWRREQEEPDSASDLSDSERLPMFPSSCTPPQLDLRAEAIGSHPLQPHHFEPWKPYLSSQSYPDVLPLPFNTWSLRQLAVFLHTEGKEAPRPRASACVERYLERLLQLEWLQIQTIQEEKGRPTAPLTVSRPRPHTAPSSSLSSPKCLRHCQRAFPLAFLSSLANPAARALSGRVCPHCRVRYPFCNGACPLYGDQWYSWFDSVPQRRGRGNTPPSRSCSESRVGLGHQLQAPGSPVGVNRHLQHMQAPGNIRRPAGGQRPKIRPLSGPPCVGSRANRSEGSLEGAGASCRNERNGNLVNTVQHNCEQDGSAGRNWKTNPAAPLKELSPVTRKGLAAMGNDIQRVKFATD